MPHPGRRLPKELQPPIFCTYPPPQEWYPYWGGRKFAMAMSQYIAYRLICACVLLFIFWHIPFASEDHPTFWVWLGSHMVAGWWLGRCILDAIRWHHMVDMGEMVDMKIKGLFLWPFQYTKLWLIFYIAAHC